MVADELLGMTIANYIAGTEVSSVRQIRPRKARYPLEIGSDNE